MGHADKEHGVINLESTVFRKPSVIQVDVHMETILLSVYDGMYYNLSSTSRDIWARLINPIRVDKLCADIADAYSADIADIQIDTLKFLAHLHGLDLIELS